MSGTGVPAIPEDWDTKQPFNINDDQIWPGMTEEPKEQKGATEMIFFLSRSSLGRSFMTVKKPSSHTDSQQLDYDNRRKEAIDVAENEVEEKYVRYCDIVNPLHLLTISSVRAGITAMRLRSQLSKIQSRSATDADRMETIALAQKILDTDTAAYSQENLRRFHWHTKGFFLWGTWDSLMFILTTLWRRNDLFTPKEYFATWDRLQKVYQNHEELMLSKRALHVAIRRFTLKVWDSRPSSIAMSTPELIKQLQSATRPEEKKDNRSTLAGNEAERIASPIATFAKQPDEAMNGSSSHGDLGSLEDFEMDDWMFWDQLRYEDAAQGSLQTLS
jgi:hypothetical protein